MIAATLDFETYYDSEYSLSKMTTESYVRDDRFEAILMSLKLSDKPVRVFKKDQIEAVIHSLPWDNLALLCHNTAFDGFILAARYGVYPALYLDTQSMARPWHHDNCGCSLKKLVEHYSLSINGRQKGDEVIAAMGKRYADFSPQELEAYSRYCGDDTELTSQLFMTLLKKTPQYELLRIDSVLRTFIQPQMVLDSKLLQEHLADTRNRKAALLDKVVQIAGRDALSSNKKFLDVLAEFGGHLPPMMFKSPEEYTAYRSTLTTPHKFDVPTKVREATPTEQKKGITGEVTVVALSKKDEEFVALLNSPDEDLVAVCEARLGVKSTIAESRAERLLDAAPRGPFPISLQYYAAHTGRLGGGGEKSNPQNFPKAKEVAAKDVGFKCITPSGVAVLLGFEEGQAVTSLGAFRKRDVTTLTVRHCITPPPGYTLVVADASQIEARIVAWNAEQEDLVAGFRNKEDIYSDFASTVYGYRCDKKNNPVERFVGKTCILGLGYGMGAVKLQDTLAIGQGDVSVQLPEEDCQRIVRIYRKEKYPRIEGMWNIAKAALEAAYSGEEMVFGRNDILRTSDKCIWLPNGMPIRYPRLHYDQNDRQYSYWGKREGRYQMVKIYGGKCVENITQALAGIIVGEAWVRINKEYMKNYKRTVAPIAMQVHDELVAVVPENEAKDFLNFMIAQMRTPPAWAHSLPLDAEGDIGQSYAACK